MKLWEPETGKRVSTFRSPQSNPCLIKENHKETTDTG